MYYSKSASAVGRKKVSTSPSDQPSSSSNNPTNSNNTTGSGNIQLDISRKTKENYSIQTIYDLPFILRETIKELNSDPSYNNVTLTGSITYEGLCYVVLLNDLFVWSIEKPQSCSRLNIPIDEINNQQTNQNHIVVGRSKLGQDKFTVFVCSPNGSFVRYWANSSKPNVTQDVTLETTVSNTKVNVYASDCQPYGIIVGNSNGSIHLVNIKQNILVAKKINKSQGMLSYLYLSRPSPVLFIASSQPSTSSQQQYSSVVNANNPSSLHTSTTRYTFVLTESSLLKYEISNNSEKIVIDYTIFKEVQKHFNNSMDLKFHQMYIDTMNDQNNEEIQILNMIFYETSASLNISKYYLIVVEIQDNQVLRVYKNDNFIAKKPITGGGIVSYEPRVSSISNNKHYLCWNDSVFYSSKSNGEIKFPERFISGSGVYNQEYHLISEEGIQKLDVAPFGVQRSSSLTSNQSTDNNTSNVHDQKPIMFEVPETDDMLSIKRNTVLKALNSISLKQQNKLNQYLDTCKNYQDLDSVIQQVSYFIIDQQPKSKFWADDAKLLGDLGGEISVQLKQQLEDKKKRHSFFIQFVEENGIKNLIEKSTLHLIEKNQVKISAAIELRNYQNQQEDKSKSSSGGASFSILPKLIQSLVSDRLPNWTNIGMNVYELFYSYVSGIDQILLCIFDKLDHQQQKQSNSVQILKEMIEGTDIFLRILTVYPIHLLDSPVLPNSENIHTLLSQVVYLLSTFIQIDLQTSATQILSQKDLGIPNVENALYDQLYRLTNIYLSSLKENEVEQFKNFKTRLIDPFVSSGRFNLATTLANKYDDYHSLINIYIADKEKRDIQNLKLVECLTKFQALGLLNNVFEYMLEKNLKAEILELPDTFNEPLYKFLSKYPDLAWIHSIRMKKWNNISNVLYNESLKEPDYLSKKEKYLSIAKISMIIDENSRLSEQQKDQQMEIINQNLNLIKSQKTFLPDIRNVLSITNIIEHILQRSNIESMDNYLICFNIIAESNLLLKEDESLDLYRHILGLAFSNEISIFCTTPNSDLQFDYGLKETNFYQLLLKLPSNDNIQEEFVVPLLEEFYKLKVKLIQDPSEKRQFQIGLTRILELYKEDNMN
ncbi:hypothetical protein CYY_007229 [Polysphondylium violaceum]|uniref:Nucleoporin Nup133/Nup155-like N-terminal domain-containing protein n=1 Tax=Polysphondylium violaceum TaxID=133409 RepID=A0A8J4PNX7_9MYCE|nr:hypothetical protein CYY_007229 [Polysphondylium violaceum]